MAFTNPYVGPRPLGASNQIYGRDKEIAGLADLLTVKRVVLFHSPSGAGKSSILHARGGVRDQLDEQFDVWATTRVNTEPTLPVTNRFVWSSLMGFEEEVPSDRRRDASTLARMSLAEGVSTRARKRNAKQFSVLIFDQFEEVLRVDPSHVDEKREFFRQLGELLANRDFWAMFVLREDYLAALEPYARLVPTHMQNRYRVDLLSVEAARDAISKPAPPCGREYTPAALDKLVDDLARVKVQQPDGTYVDERGPYIEPMQLQVACFNLWEKMDAADDRVDPEDIAKHGDVTEALASYYAGRIAQIANGDVAVERAVRRWIGTELITPDGVRSQVLKGPKESQGLANALIEQLEKAHLVRPEQRGSSVRFELAHDRLVQPVTTNNAKWFEDHLSPMQKRAELWNKQGQPESLLVTGGDIEQLREWTPSERFEKDFVRLSEARNAAIKRNRRLTIASIASAAIAVIGLIVTLIVLRQSEVDKRRAIDSEARASTALRNLKSAQETLDGANRELGLKNDTLQKAGEELALAVERTEAAAAATRKSLAVSRVQEAARLVYIDRPREALAYLADALRKDPDSIAARTLMVDLLRYRSWITAGEPFPPFKDIYPRYALSPDGSTALISEQGINGLFDTRTGKKLSAIDTVSGCLAFSPDSRYIAICQSGEDAGLQIRATRTGALVGKPIDLKKGLRALSFGPDGRRIAVARSDGDIDIWDVPAGDAPRETIPQSLRDQEWYALRLGSGGGLAYGGGGSFFKFPGLQETKVAEYRTGGAAGFSLDGSVFFHSAGVWRTSDGKRATPDGLNDKLGDRDVTLSTSPDGKQLIARLDEGQAEIWDIDSNERIATIDGPILQAPALSQNHRAIAADYHDGPARVRIWEFRQAARRITALGGDIWAAAFTSDGKELLLRSKGDEREIWKVPFGPHKVDVSQNARMAFKQGRARFFPGFSRDGKFIALSVDGAVQVVDAKSGGPIGKPVVLNENLGVAELHFTSNNARLVALLARPVVRIFDIASGKSVGPEMYTRDFAGISHDGKRALVFRSLDEAELLELDTMKSISVKINQTQFSNVHFSPDGKYFAAFGAATRVTIWDAATGKEYGTPLIHTAPVQSARFDWSGKRIVTGVTGGAAQIWDFESRLPIGLPIPMRNDVVRANFSPNGRYLVLTDARRGPVEIVELPPTNLSPAQWSEIIDLAELLAKGRLTDTGALVPLSAAEFAARKRRFEDPSHKGPLRINDHLNRIFPPLGASEGSR